MAKKKNRINVKFIGIGLTVLVVLGGLALVLRRTVFRPQPEKYVAAARADMEAGRWEDAEKNAGSAIRYSKVQDPSLWTLYADVCMHRTYVDKDAMQHAVSGYQQALQIEPTNKTALERLVSLNRQWLASGSGLNSASDFDAVRDMAGKLLAIDPENTEARVVGAWSVLERWRRRIQTDRAAVDEARATIEDVHKKAPENADVLWLMITVRIVDADELFRARRTADLKKLGDESEQLIEDSFKGQENNAQIQYRGGLALRSIAQVPIAALDRDQVGGSATQPAGEAKPGAAPARPWNESPEGKAAVAKMRDLSARGLEHLARASELAKPTDFNFADIRETYARALMSPEQGMADLKPADLQKLVMEGRGKAEQIYVKTLQEQPGELGIRLAYADMIAKDPKRRDEAVKLLQETPPVSPLWIGVRGHNARLMFPIALAQQLCEMRLDQAEGTRVKAERDPFLVEAQSNYDKLVAADPRGESRPAIMSLKGRIQLAKGQALDGAQTLNRALQSYPRDPVSMENQDRLELMVRLANAYRMTQQTGEAKRLYGEILQYRPAHFPSRAALTELLISEGDLIGANQQIDLLTRQFGEENPGLLRLRLLALDRAKDKEKITALFAKLPETNNPERWEKAKLAAQVGNTDDAIRLYEAIRKEIPNAADVAIELTQLYTAKGDKASAIAVMRQAVETNPNAPGLKTVLTQMENPEEGPKARLKALEGIQDPIRREIALADYYGQLNDDEQAKAHATAAEKIAPDDFRVLDALFRAAAQRKDLEKATSYLDRLSRVNPDLATVYRTRLAILAGKPDEAYEQAQKLTQSRPDFAESWVVLGQALFAKQRYEDSIAAFQQALDRQTENFDAIRSIIQAYLTMNPKRWGKATDEVTGTKATDAKYYIELGQKLFPNVQMFTEWAYQWEMANGDPAKAIAPRELAVKENPQDPVRLQQLGTTYVAVAKAKDAPPPGTAAPTNTPTAVVSKAEQDKIDANRTMYLTKARDTFAKGAEMFPQDPRFAIYAADLSTQIGDAPAGEKILLAAAAREPLKGKSDASIVVAEFYNKAGMFDKAEKTLRDGFAANPMNVQVQRALVQMLNGQRKSEEALKILESANQTDMSIVQARVDLLLAARRLDEANKVVEDALVARPAPEMQKLRAKVEIQSGKLREARAHIDQLIAASPNDVENIFLRAMATLGDASADPGPAIDDLNKVIAVQPNIAEPYVHLSDAYVRRHMDDEAIRHMQSAVRVAPNEKALKMKLLDLYASHKPPLWSDAERLLKDLRSQPATAKDPDLMRAEAQMWMARKDVPKGLELLRQVYQQAPDNLANVQAYFNALVEAKDFKTLSAETDKVAKASPNVWWVYQYRGMIRKRGNNDPRGALAELKNGLAVAQRNNDEAGMISIIHAIATEVSPAEAKNALAPLAEKDPRWQMLLSDILNEARDIPGALAAVEKALASPALRPADLPRALRSAGYLYLASNQPAKGVDCYRRLLREVPNDPTALNNLATQLSEPGPLFAPAEAVQCSQVVYDQALKDGDPNAMPYIEDTHGWALVQAGRVDEGIDILRRALEHKRLPDISYHLGRAFLKKTPPVLVDAERALLDAKNSIDDLERERKPVDPTLKAKVDAAFAEVRELKAKAG